MDKIIKEFIDREERNLLASRVERDMESHKKSTIRLGLLKE